MPHRISCGERLRTMRPVVIQCVLLLLLLAGGSQVQAQQEIPDAISPLRIESDHNGVNIVSGKTVLPVPVLSVPAAPNLRFDWLQHAAPRIKGKQWGQSGELAQSTYSIDTGMGTSEAFRCVDFDCTSVTGTGSVFTPNANFYHQGGSGVSIHYNLKQVETTGNPSSMMYYASFASYPSGETIAYDYETTTLPGDTFGRTFYRPTMISSNLGYFISIQYHPGAIENNEWDRPAVATLYKSSAPTTPLGKLSYTIDGSTITDHGNTVSTSDDRVYTCDSCINGLNAQLEQYEATLTLPGEASPTLDASPVSGSGVIGSLTRDGVQWNYDYMNLQSDWPNGYVYSKVTVTGPHGYQTVYDIDVRDSRNVIEQITDSNGRTTQVDFDTAYRLREIIYPEGNEVSVAYDSFGNITSRTATPKAGSGLSAATETAHYPTTSCSLSVFQMSCHRPSWHRDGLLRQTDFQYNAGGQLTVRTDPIDEDGVRRRTTITYATTGLRRREVVQVCGDTTTCGTPNEIRTEYDYWQNTFLPSIERRTDAAQGVTLETHYTYDDAGRVLVEDGPLSGTGDAKYFRYDAFGRREWEIGPMDTNGIRLARKLTYRPADDKIIRVQEGSVTSPTSTTLDEFRRIDHAYDLRRNPKSEKVSAGGTTHTVVQRTFDQQNRLECEARRMNPAAFGSLPTSACTLGAEDSFGPDRITRNVYDDAGQLLAVQRAYGTPLQQDHATYTYSPNGKRATVKDANDNLSTFEYDGFDRPSKLRFPVAATGANQSSTSDYELYGYDAVGNRTSLRKRDAKTITYAYDALNRVRLKTVPTSTDGAAGYSVHYRYDVRGLMTRARFGTVNGDGVTNTYDGFGQLRSSSSNMGGTARTVTSDYDVRGNRTRITYPGGAFFEYAYDTADLPIHLSENGPSATLASFVYDGEGRRDWIARDAAGAITDYEYDALSRLEVLTHDLDGTTGTAHDAGFGFAYNPASQVTTRVQTNDAYEFPLSPAVKSYVVNGRNQYTQVGGTTHTWDANGNLIDDGPTTFGYDTENRLVSASGAKIATLKYDPLGRLWEGTTASGVPRFVYDGDRLIAEYSTGGAVQRRYVHGPGVDEPLVWYEGAAVSAATRRYLHADHQGSIVAASTASGAMQQVRSYDAYGVTAAANSLRFQYTGQAAIPELGLLYYKARFYNPALGRFMQTDPIGYDDDINLYAYVGNDPLNKTDPTGRIEEFIYAISEAGPWVHGAFAYGVVAVGGFSIGFGVGTVINYACGGNCFPELGGDVYDILHPEEPEIPQASLRTQPPQPAQPPTASGATINATPSRSNSAAPTSSSAKPPTRNQPDAPAKPSEQQSQQKEQKSQPAQSTRENRPSRCGAQTGTRIPSC